MRISSVETKTRYNQLALELGYQQKQNQRIKTSELSSVDPCQIR